MVRHRDGVDDFVERLQRPVQFGGADADAAAVQHRVGAAVDQHTAMLGELAEVTVVPYAGVALEIRGAVARAVGVVPEAEGQRRERPRADQLTAAAWQCVAVIVEERQRHAETR